jgi:hypothetical protein
MSGWEELRRLETAATPGPWEHHSAGTGIRGGGSYNFITLPGGKGIIAERGNSGTPADAEFIVAARNQLPGILAALDAVLALAEQWRYKGEFGWGAWQEGHGPDLEGTVLDSAAADIRAAVTEALEGK